MAINYNPQIIKYGMVLYLDAVNSKSFANTTTWYDISGNNNHGTMYGTPVFSTDGGGCFDFSTVTGAAAASASMGFTFSSNMIPTIGSFTLSCWIKNPPASGQIGLFSNAGSGDGYRFGIGNTSVYTLIGGVGGIGYSEPSTNFLSTLSSSLWYNVCMIFDRSGANSSGTPQWQLYLNGVIQNTTNMSATQPAFTSTAPGLVRSACCTLYTGKLSVFSAHSRALTPAEVLKNFNALRGRFRV